MKHEMVVLDGKNFEMLKRNLTGLVVASFVFAELQKAADSLSSGQRCLMGVAAWWEGTQHPSPS